MAKIKLNSVSLIVLMLSVILIQIKLQAQNKKLSFSQVYEFREPKILKRLPVIKGWIDDENYLQVKNENDKAMLMKINAGTGEETILVDYSKINENIPEGFDATNPIDETYDFTGYLFEKDNDLYFYSVTTNKFSRLTQTEEKENNSTFSPNGRTVAFTRGHNLFVVDIESAVETQLTFDGSDDIYNGWASWVYWEEIIGRETHNKAYWWSPNSEMIAFLWFDDSPVPKFPLYYSNGAHGKLVWEHYPEAGDPNPDVKLGIAHLKENKIVWVDEDPDVDQYTAWPVWTNDCKELFYQVLNRDQDDLILFATDPNSGKNRLLYEEEQPTWVDFFNDVYIFRNGKDFILRSDKDGWKHLYFYDMNGEFINRITAGEWMVEKIVKVDEAIGVIYFEGWKDNSLDRHLFKVNLDGSELTQITKGNGSYESEISPNGSYFYTEYSNVSQPKVLSLYNGKGEFIKTIAERKTDLYDDYIFGKTELFTITTKGGIKLPAGWVLPPDFDETKKYPVILAIYGGPGFEDVKDSYFHFLDRYFLAQNGIIYFQVDHRGSSHFGKRGTSLMFRNLGKVEMEDYIEAVKWLRKQPFIDSTKIGIEGASYGGYMALMGLTYGADYFTYGYAEASGTDWRLYDNIYTERYMNKPEENPEGYEFGSVMTHAEKLKGKLRIVHGTTDDNAHFQQVLQLIDVLTDLNKDFELMIYPNEGHGRWMPKWSYSQRNRINFWFKNFIGREFQSK
jgi:dipeptidyl-peptidase-4